MKAIREAAGQDLQWKWIRTKEGFLKWKGEFELRSGDEVLAMLHDREKSTGWTSGEAADGRWTFKGQSIRYGDIVITELDSQAEIAVVKHERKQSIFKRDKAGWSENYIGFSDGRMLTWKKASSWHDDWDWVDSDGRPLIHFQRGNHVVLEPLALSLPELSLLVIVGWHLMKVQEAERPQNYGV